YFRVTGVQTCALPIYDRTVTTVVNAALRPRCRRYLRRIAELADEVLVMTSSGGLLPAAEAAELPAALLLSGPAGGVRAGAAAARAAERRVGAGRRAGA